jgi:hypothetical protein
MKRLGSNGGKIGGLASGKAKRRPASHYARLAKAAKLRAKLRRENSLKKR